MSFRFQLYVMFSFCCSLWLIPCEAMGVGLVTIKSGEREWDLQMGSGKLLSREIEKQAFYTGERSRAT
jgi:hypothetical protein